MQNCIQLGKYTVVQPSKETLMQYAMETLPYVKKPDTYINDRKVPYNEIEDFLVRMYSVQRNHYLNRNLTIVPAVWEMVTDDSVAVENLTGAQIIDLASKQPDKSISAQSQKYRNCVPFYLQNANAFYLKQNGDEFVHVFTNKVFGLPAESGDLRLYLNLQAENTVEFCRLFMNRSKKVINESGMPLLPYFKFAGRHRPDQFIVYCSYENVSHYLDVLEQIKKERPDLCVGTDSMPEIWGTINNWIGFGENVPKKHEGESYTSLRESAEYKFKIEAKKQGLTFGDAGLVELYDSCMREYDIDPDNYTLNLTSPLKSKVLTNYKK